ncbi:MAG TPA: hypothetical protein PLL54_02510 [Dermatophilaceae bacterium]|nr:hypothetical protein [Dermatophilaceae bacterium]
MTPPTARAVATDQALTELLDLADTVHAALAAYEHGVLTWQLTGGVGRHPREAMYAAFEDLYRYARTLTLDNRDLRATLARGHHHPLRSRPARAPRTGSQT